MVCCLSRKAVGELKAERKEKQAMEEIKEKLKSECKEAQEKIMYLNNINIISCIYYCKMN